MSSYSVSTPPFLHLFFLLPGDLPFSVWDGAFSSDFFLFSLEIRVAVHGQSFVFFFFFRVTDSGDFLLVFFFFFRSYLSFPAFPVKT